MVSAYDPQTERELSFVDLMQMLATTFTGIAVDLEEGQVDQARERWRAFAALFGSMKETCGTCHDTERKYYVDATMQAAVDQLGEALSGSQIDPATVAALSQRIGVQSCSGCHMVHLPAAYSRQTPHQPERRFPATVARRGAGSNRRPAMTYDLLDQRDAHRAADLRPPRRGRGSSL